MSQSPITGPSSPSKLVIELFPVLELVLVEAAAAEALEDANDDPALGGWGSGGMLVKSISHAPLPSGLRLRSRSPRPFRRLSSPLRRSPRPSKRRAWRTSCREVCMFRLLSLFNVATLSDKARLVDC
jgi:hypothetical protein